MKHHHHLELYAQLIQSPQVQVALGDDNTERIYRLPIDLLRKRSTVLAKMIPHNGEQEVVPCKVPLTTSAATINAFIAWIMAARPQLEKQDTLEDMVELGILADQLDVWALSNQVMDLIESQVKNGVWKWSPPALNGIYEKVAAGRPLRRLVQATLLTMDVAHSMFISEEENSEDRALDAVFLAHAALGCDYHRAKRGQGKSKWMGTKRPCEYHEHPWAGVCEADEIEMYDASCPYMTDDCYPVWKVQDLNHVECGDDIEALTLSKEEDCIVGTRYESEPSLEVETGPEVDVADDDATKPKTEMKVEKDLAVTEEEERPQMTVRAIHAEIERMSGKDRKKLKKLKDIKGKKMSLGVTEEQPDGWVHEFD